MVFSTAGLSPMARGRLEKHFATRVRHEHRLYTFRELYSARGIRVEHHPQSQLAADRYRLVLDDSGAFLQIPKMVYDAAVNAETLAS
jgi:hypothetical protein